MLIEIFSEWFVSFGFDKFKDKLKNQNDERQLKNDLTSFFFFIRRILKELIWKMSLICKAFWIALIILIMK